MQHADLNKGNSNSMLFILLLISKFINLFKNTINKFVFKNYSYVVLLGQTTLLCTLIQNFY